MNDFLPFYSFLNWIVLFCDSDEEIPSEIISIQNKKVCNAMMQTIVERKRMFKSSFGLKKSL